MHELNCVANIRNDTILSKESFVKKEANNISWARSVDRAGTGWRGPSTVQRLVWGQVPRRFGSHTTCHPRFAVLISRHPFNFAYFIQIVHGSTLCRGPCEACPDSPHRRIYFLYVSLPNIYEASWKKVPCFPIVKCSNALTQCGLPTPKSPRLWRYSLPTPFQPLCLFDYANVHWLNGNGSCLQPDVY